MLQRHVQIMKPEPRLRSRNSFTSSGRCSTRSGRSTYLALGPRTKLCLAVRVSDRRQGSNTGLHAGHFCQREAVVDRSQKVETSRRSKKDAPKSKSLEQIESAQACQPRATSQLLGFGLVLCTAVSAWRSARPFITCVVSDNENMFTPKSNFCRKRRVIFWQALVRGPAEEGPCKGQPHLGMCW